MASCERPTLIVLPTASTLALKARHVSDPLIDVASLMADCLSQAADDVAADTRDEAFDDTTSRGSLLYRRARNRMMTRFADDHRIVCDTTDNALHIRVGPTAISFYSARNGLDSPDVSGSRTKRAVVDESQMMFTLDDRSKIQRLVLMHEASPDGLVRAALGVLDSATTWSWRVTLFDRFALTEDAEPDTRGAPYDERPEAKLPPMARRNEGKLDETGEQ